MNTKICTIVSFLLLTLSLPLQAQKEVKRLDKLFDKTVKDIAGGITSVSTVDYGDEYSKFYQFTIPRSQAKDIMRLDEAMKEVAPKAYKSWMKQAGGDSNNTLTIHYDDRHPKTYTFGTNFNMNYNVQCLNDPDDSDKNYVYVLAWGEDGDNITGGIFKFYNGKAPTAKVESPKWFYIKFNAEGACIGSKGDGNYVRTGRPASPYDEAYCWRMEKQGGAYAFYNMQGLQLYYDDNFVRAGSKPKGTTLFYILPSSTMRVRGFSEDESKDYYEISIKPSPRSNERVWFNQWGAAGDNRLIGLYLSPDWSNALQLITVGDETDIHVDTPKANSPQLSVQTSGQGNGGGLTAEAKTPQTGADFLEQLNNCATLFTTEAGWCVRAKGTKLESSSAYSYHVNLWTGATNRIMRLCKEHADLLDDDERTIVYNLLDKLLPLCDKGFDSLGAMITVAQKAVRK